MKSGWSIVPGVHLASHLEARLPAIQHRLLAWYSRHKRTLPWRQTRDPYKIVVSEVMLHQTQVSRVIPKYHEFLDRFPTFSDLALADRSDVIRAWAGLGYNRRSVQLHELARSVVEQYGGELPGEPRALQQFVGIGKYTAAAVACFAFGRQVPALDTNAGRVIARLLADSFDYRAPPGRPLAAAANRILPRGRAAEWNQALMDLGASICTARRPSCGHCPVAGECAGRTVLKGSAGTRLHKAAERRPAYGQAAVFLGSSRYYRGRIVERLRRQPPGRRLTLDELGMSIRDDFSPAFRAWLVQLLAALEADGLVRLEGGHGKSQQPVTVRLP
jgi:A/G-specific adenine glycosylase